MPLSSGTVGTVFSSDVISTPFSSSIISTPFPSHTVGTAFSNDIIGTEFSGGQSGNASYHYEASSMSVSTGNRGSEHQHMSFTSGFQ
jgi:hypothetical protein